METLNDISVLIVEDEALIAEDIKDICTLYGYRVTGLCYTPGQALLAIDRADFDFAIFDINLEAELNGIEVAGYLNRSGKNIPFVYLTSYADKTTLDKAKHTFPMGYIVKPFNKEQLMSTIEISMANYARFRMPGCFDKEALERRFKMKFSDREFQVMTLICEGKTNQQIAALEFMSVNTVKYHIKNLYEKFQIGSRSQLMAKLRQ